MKKLFLLCSALLFFLLSADQVDFLSKPVSAGKASLAENAYTISRVLDAANFSPVSQCLIAGTNDSLKNFSTFSDCRLSIDILAKDFSTISQRDTLDRLNHIIVVCQKIDARGKSLESLSSLGISDDKLKGFLVVEWCSDTLPYSAVYCGEEIYFIKINHAGEVFVQHFVNKNLIRNVESIKTIISEYQNYGDLSFSGRGSVFWFITDFQINKSIVIHDAAMHLSLHGKRGAGDMKLQKIYDECLRLIDNIGIKRY